MKIPFRQGIVRHQSDIFNNPEFLVQELSGNVSLNVSPDYTIISIAHGDSNYLFTEKSSIINAWTGPFVGGTDYWLYWDINLLTGVRTFGYTLYVPITSSVAPPTPMVDQHWFDIISTTMKVWNGVRWIEKARVFACKYENATSFIKMSASPGNTFTGTQVGLNVPNRSGALIFDNSGDPIKREIGKFFTTEDAFVTGVPNSASIRIQGIDVEAIAQENIPKYYTVHFSNFSDVEISDPNTQLTRPVGIIEEDAFTGEVIKVIFDGIVQNPDWAWTTPTGYVYIANDGSLTETPAIPNAAPFARILNEYTILIDSSRIELTGGGVSDGVVTGGSLNAGTGDLTLSRSMSLPDIIITGFSTLSDVSTLTSSLANKLNLDGTNGPMLGDLSMGAYKITGLATPSLGTDAATKDYVDTVFSGGTDGVVTGGSFLTGTLTLTRSNSLPNVVITGFTDPAHTHAKADITDFIESDYVHTTGVESISGNKTFNNDVIVSGNLTINGTTTTVNSTNLNITDNIILLNTGEVGAGVTLGTAGIQIDRGTSTDSRLLFDESDDKWKVDPGSGVLTGISLEDHTHPSTDITGLIENVYDIAAQVFGSPANGVVVFRFVTPRSFSMPDGSVASQAYAHTTSTAAAVFNVQKNGVGFGTVTFNIATNVGVISLTPTSFVAGDRITIVAPSPQDATLADVEITLTGLLT